MRAPLSHRRLKTRTSVRVSSLNLGHSVHCTGWHFLLCLLSGQRHGLIEQGLLHHMSQATHELSHGRQACA